MPEKQHFFLCMKNSYGIIVPISPLYPLYVVLLYTILSIYNISVISGILLISNIDKELKVIKLDVVFWYNT